MVPRKDTLTRWVVAAQNRDEEAFARLVTSSQEAVLARLRRYGFDGHDAEDVAASVFLECWVKLPLLREPDRFGGWLMALLHGFACEASRKRKVEQRCVSFVADESLTEHEAPETGERDARHVRELVAVLNAEDRALLEEKYLRKVTLREIAARSGLKIYHVAHRLRRIKQDLRVRWQPADGEVRGPRHAMAGVEVD